MPWRDTVHHSGLGQLIDSLEQIPALRDLGTRRLCLELLSDHLGARLVIEELPGTRAHLISIIHACRRQHPRALSAFIEVVEQVEPGSIPVQRARAAFQDMIALDLIQDDDRDKLLALLRNGPTDRIAEFVRWASGDVVELTSNRIGPTDALALLERLNARPDGLPPLYVFVERFATIVDDRRANRLREWNDRQAENAGLTTELKAVRQELPPLPPQPVVAYLVIRAEPDLLDPDLFAVVHWRQRNPNRWRPRRGEPFAGDLDAVRIHVADLVAEAEAGWARDAERIQVEFLLPYALLNLPVDQWDVEYDSSLPRPLGIHYHVVLRSLDRARSRRWHREWRRRWELLKRVGAQEASPTTYWLWSDDSRPWQLAVLEAELAMRTDVVSLVLRSPPGEADHGEVMVGVRTGMPVMIWHRADDARESFDSELSAMRGHLPDLVEQVRMLRSRAGQAAQPTHVGNRVSLLWDDPDRPVEPPDPPAAPAMEGSSR